MAVVIVAVVIVAVVIMAVVIMAIVSHNRNVILLSDFLNTFA